MGEGGSEDEGESGDSEGDSGSDDKDSNMSTSNFNEFSPIKNAKFKKNSV